MMHRANMLMVALALCLLAGCQSAPAIPEHKYYRLHALVAPPAGSTTGTPFGKELAVRAPRAEGLYGERAIIFTDARQRVLQQYHYHHWLYAPDQMVQELLVERLRQAQLATAVRPAERGGDTPFTVSGRIVRFEKITASPAVASATLELRLEQKNRVLWRRSYAAEVAAADDSIGAFALAMEAALNRISDEFIDDLRHIKID